MAPGDLDCAAESSTLSSLNRMLPWRLISIFNLVVPWLNCPIERDLVIIIRRGTFCCSECDRSGGFLCCSDCDRCGGFLSGDVDIDLDLFGVDALLLSKLKLSWAEDLIISKIDKTLSTLLESSRSLLLL